MAEPVAPEPASVAGDVLDGTIAELASLAGGGGMRVKGYGLVVGLGEKGSSEVPSAIRSALIADMMRRGVDKSVPGAAEFDLAGLIEDKDTAVVVVSAWIPPGTPPGTPLDATVAALPGTQTLSLDGGILYETELKTFQSGETGVRESYRVEARAKGAVFVNPFIDRDKGDTTARLRTGQIIGGATTVGTRTIRLVLDHPDYRKAKTIRDVINERFAGASKVANAKSPSLIELGVPRRYRRDYGHFLELVTHLYLRRAPQADQMKARRLAEQILAPGAPHEEIALIWEAMGKHVVDSFRRLYTSENAVAAYYAARAGVRLGDTTALAVLRRTATDSASALRLAAVAELGRSNHGGATALLTELLDDGDALIRIAAYEALCRPQPRGPVERHDVGGRFIVDAVRTQGKCLIYATRSGEPKLVLFGTEIPVLRPIMFSSSDGDVTVHAHSDDERLKVYRRVGPQRLLSDELEILPDAKSLALAMGRTPVPGPEGGFQGLGMTYSQVVGALYRLCRKAPAQWIPAEFMLQRTQAAVTMTPGTAIEGRPDSSGVSR